MQTLYEYLEQNHERCIKKAIELLNGEIMTSDIENALKVIIFYDDHTLSEIEDAARLLNLGPQHRCDWCKNHYHEIKIFQSLIEDDRQMCQACINEIAKQADKPKCKHIKEVAVYEDGSTVFSRSIVAVSTDKKMIAHVKCSVCPICGEDICKQ